MQGLVAEQSGKLIGLAHYVFHLNTIMIEDICYLQDLFVDPSERGRGIGGQLIATVSTHAMRLGIQSAYWHTHSSNATAMRLYDQVATNTNFIVYRMPLDTRQA